MRGGVISQTCDVAHTQVYMHIHPSASSPTPYPPFPPPSPTSSCPSHLGTAQVDVHTVTIRGHQGRGSGKGLGAVPTKLGYQGAVSRVYLGREHLVPVLWARHQPCCVQHLGVAQVCAVLSAQQPEREVAGANLNGDRGGTRVAAGER